MAWRKMDFGDNSPKPELPDTREINEKPPGDKSRRVFCDQRYVSRSEFEATIKALQERLDALHGVQSGHATGLELAPRPPVVHKKKVGRRYKLASTIDGALYDRIRELEEEGYQLSHLLDSAFRLLFGKPKLSFESKETEEKEKSL